ncbi:hypothetical protein [Solimonas marina]|uniref:Uncharacterized protein n=1 Tax=Solimonas marina TaxID=2714601 RepID=A0A970B8F3_9GAMM|nr:hypothetical protein [Solimonas marina]NKF24680.1 hypothetical protein [Solimonas marina]
MSDEKCPFEFNFDPASFKVGDTVSYRVPKLTGFPFAAQVKAVYDDYIEIVDAGEPGKIMRATRESRPVVNDEDALN